MQSTFFVDTTWNTDGGDIYRYAVDVNYVAGTSEQTIANISGIDSADIPSGYSTPLVEMLSIFPVPATHTLNVSLDGAAVQEGVLGISDLTGRTLTEQAYSPNTGTHTFDIAQLPAGTYILYLKSGDQLFQRTFEKL